MCDEAYLIARQCQQRLSDKMSINFLMTNNSAPHINIISGSTTNINSIISSIKKFKFNCDNSSELFGLGVLLTPEPLSYMRFFKFNFYERA